MRGYQWSKYNAKREQFKLDPGLYLGVDGEGQGSNPHRYVLLCANDSANKVRRYVAKDEGLSTSDCLEFILSLQAYSNRLFSFVFSYDLTKILQDVDNKTIYHLMRPNLRKGRDGTMNPVYWRKYKLQWNNSRFAVARLHGPYVVVWDLFKFYQSSFVKALRDWKTGDKEVVDFIEKMKAERSHLETIAKEQTREYCFSECMYMGQLANKLVDAAKEAGLELDQFYGAGTIGGLVLDKMGIKDKRRDPIPEMQIPVLMSFFGGRFENNRIGKIPGPVHSWDISSAYPYHITNLPCLECGEWSYTTSRKRMLAAQEALVCWEGAEEHYVNWGPYPFRTKKQTILFPVTGGTGYVWRREFLAGHALYSSGISKPRMKHAWVYETDCTCKPFADYPKYYRARYEMGKDTAGKVMKLGVNAGYGKLAQSIGDPKYNCWIWAAIITSNTRAMLLEAIMHHKNPNAVFALATDGIYSTELAELGPRKGVQATILMPPNDTGTSDLPKPLGGWEYKEVPSGMFCARPGINFPLDVGIEEDDNIRARGFGRRVLMNFRREIMHEFERNPNGKFALPWSTRFHGLKSSIHIAKDEFGQPEYRRSEHYGEWFNYAPYMSFNPQPKRASINPDGTLEPFHLEKGVESFPYKPDFFTESEEIDPFQMLEDILDESMA